MEARKTTDYCWNINVSMSRVSQSTRVPDPYGEAILNYIAFDLHAILKFHGLTADALRIDPYRCGGDIGAAFRKDFYISVKVENLLIKIFTGFYPGETIFCNMVIHESSPFEPNYPNVIAALVSYFHDFELVPDRYEKHWISCHHQGNLDEITRYFKPDLLNCIFYPMLPYHTELLTYPDPPTPA